MGVEKNNQNYLAFDENSRGDAQKN